MIYDSKFTTKESFFIAFHSNGQNLDVKLTYNAPNGISSDGSASNPLITEFQLALVAIENVVDSNTYECLDSCPKVDGFDTGLATDRGIFPTLE